VAHWIRLVVIFALVSTQVVLIGVVPAAADTPWAPVFSVNAPGRIDFVANTVATCNASAAGCAAAQAGGNSTNNAFGGNMVLVDVDGDPATNTSSTATYTVPAGGSVLWAGLYWAGFYTGADADKDDVLFQTPGSGGYVPINATWFDKWANNGSYYTGHADVTSLVQAGGSGTYGVGNIAVSPGTSATYGGWTLIIVEEDPSEPWRNMTVNQGFELIGGSNTANFTVSGFTAPPIGPVQAEIGIMASEGDIGYTGDYAELNGVRLSNGLNPATNFFNSSLSDLGAFNTGLNPNYPANTLGFDADIVSTSGVIGPGDTTAQVEIGTQGDGFFPTAVTTAIEIYVPNLTVNFIKTATDLNGEQLHPGDVVEFSLSWNNTGDDPSIETQISDAIPAGLTYVPNSLYVAQDDSPTGPRTDAAGDDTAWFDGTAVNFNVGTGADATNGGRVIPLSQGGRNYEIRFQTTVDAGTEGTTLQNQAELDYVAEFIGEPFSSSSNVVDLPIEPLVDLSISKTDAVDPVVAGDTILYTVKVDNAGPSTADNVVVTDTLPAGTTFDAAASDPRCSAVGQTVTCTAVSIGSGASDSFVIAAVTDGLLAVASVTNQASVTSDTHEHDTANNTTSEPTAITREVDLAVDKTAPATVTAGGQISYSISVKNGGPSDATNVSLLDSLPAGVSFVSATPSGAGTCSGVVSCSWPTIPDGGVETVTIIVDVPGSTPDGTALVNAVKVGSSEPDSDPSNNSDTVTTEVVTDADLAVVKTTLDAPLVAGETVSYDITVTNNGPSDAQNVTVTDPVPAGLTLDAAASSASCSLGGSIATCSTATVASGASVSYTLVFAIDAATADGTLVTNKTKVDSDTPDSDPSNDTSSVTDPVERQADLTILKDDGTTTVSAGNQLTYTIAYDNLGPSDASNVVITDVLPAGVSFDSVSGPGCAESGGVVTCSIGALAVGAGGTITIVVTVDAGLNPSSQLLNTANIGGDEPDPNLTNNDTEVTTDVDRVSELNVEKADLADPVLAGETITYTMTVTSLGPSDDTGVVLTDVIPAGLTFVSASDPLCGESAGVVTCPIGTMLVGDVFTVDVVVDVDPATVAGTIFSNTVEADGDFSDPVDDTEETTVNTLADLSIVKAGPATATAGTSMTWTIDVLNSGPSDALNVR